MAAGTVCVTLPVVAAAIGLYLCDKNDSSKASAYKEIGLGVRGAFEAVAATTKVDVKLAPQFDGLDCFETLVGHL